MAAARIRPLTIGDAAAAASLIREAFAAQSRATDPPSSALPAWRGQGIARALLAAGEAEARRRGLKRMTLRVRLALGENQRLFAGFGFAPAGQGAHPGYRQPTFLLMEKRLA